MRLGRRDEDVGRFALESRALDGRRVAGADGNRGNAVSVSTRGRTMRDPGERRPQVALDVDRERFER